MPAFLRATLIASPMPRVPPVTTATRPMKPLLFCFEARLCVEKPACKFAADQRVEQIHPLAAVVEAFKQRELLPPGRNESLAAADAQLLERLQAIGGEAGRGDGEALD